MLLKRGVFAGALFAGALFGAVESPPDPPAPPNTAGGGGSGGGYSTSRYEVDHTEQLRRQEDELIELTAMVVNYLITEDLL